MLKKEVRDVSAQTDHEEGTQAGDAATAITGGGEEVKAQQGSETAAVAATAVPVAELAAAEARSVAAEAVAGSRQAEVDLLRRALSGAQSQLAVLRGLVEQLQSRRAQEGGVWGSEGGAAAAAAEAVAVVGAAVEEGPKPEEEQVDVPETIKEIGAEAAPVKASVGFIIVICYLPVHVCVCTCISCVAPAPTAPTNLWMQQHKPSVATPTPPLLPQEPALKQRRPGPLHFLTALAGRTMRLGTLGVVAIAFSRTPHGVRAVEAIEARAGVVSRWRRRSSHQEHEAAQDDDDVGDSHGAADA